MTQIFEIKADSQRITDTISTRFVSLTVTDTSGYESDQMTLVLDDSPDPVTGSVIELPSKGVILDVSLGYRVAGKSSVYPAGRWVVDEVEPSGGILGNIITITSNGADFNGSMKEKKTRSWSSITLPGILETIASEHSLEAKIRQSFEAVVFEHIDQTEESDLGFITRLARDHDALGKVVGNVLVFDQRNTGINTQGQLMPTISLGSPGNIIRWRMKQPGRTQYSSVVAKWYDVMQAKHFEEKAGTGEPVLYLEKTYPSAEEAREAAQSRYKASKRSDERLTLTGSVPDNAPLMLAETNLNITGLRAGVDGLWRVDRCQLSMSTTGFSYSVDAVKPSN